MKAQFDQYLKILKIRRKYPSFEYLTELLTSHIINIPFENISKLYYLKTIGLKYIPDFESYLEGIKKYNFGGTCYSNNYYFNQLLKNLGFEVKLCGADMSAPDVHLVNVVSIDSKEFLIDVGYGSPFFRPIPLFLKENQYIYFGNEKYIVLPQNEAGYTELKQFVNETHKHGYQFKPIDRSINEFENVIKNSFMSTSTFLNRITAIKFDIDSSTSVRNFSLLKSGQTGVVKTQIRNKEELIEQINQNFKISKNVLRTVLESLNLSENQ